MIEFLAGKIALQIKQANPEETKSIPVLQFGLIMIISTVIILFTTSIVSFYLGTLTETWTVLMTFAFLRMFSGGFHFKTAALCTLSTIVGAITLPLLPVPEDILIVINLTTLILVGLFSPHNIENQSRFFKKEHSSVLKVIATLIVFGLILIESKSVDLALFVQALTLIPVLEGGEEK